MDVSAQQSQQSITCGTHVVDDLQVHAAAPLQQHTSVVLLHVGCVRTSSYCQCGLCSSQPLLSCGASASSQLCVMRKSETASAHGASSAVVTARVHLDLRQL
eukprot:1908515-Amphidinium_carterae.1